MKFSSACLLILLFISCSRPSEEKNAKTSLTPAEFKQQMETTADAMILDVRSMEEVQLGRIRGEVNFDYNAPEFELLIKGLDKTKTYFVYCASGVRSGKAAEKLRDEGFTKVYTLEGGLKAWRAAGLEVQN